MTKLKKRLGLMALCALLLLSLAAAGALLIRRGRPYGERFQAHFIDVGQGDCALIISDGSAMLIDGGTPSGGEAVEAYLKRLGVSSLEVLIATHPHADHIGGLPAVIEGVEVKKAYLSPYVHTTVFYEQLIDALEARNTDTRLPRVGESFALGSAACTFIGDGEGFQDGAENSDINNASLVLRVTFGGETILFTGDMEALEEQILLEDGVDLKCDLLKVGHHGSDTSTTPELLEAASPRAAVISVGKNGYGHPSPAILERLAGLELYRTDTYGTAVFGSSGEGIHILSGDEAVYIGNVRTRVFHRPSCETRPKLINTRFILTRDRALRSGYRPCGACKP